MKAEYGSDKHTIERHADLVRAFLPRQCQAMDIRSRPILDMTPQGEFRPSRSRLSWPMRIGLAALGVSLVAGLVASAALMIYLALVLIPVAAVAAAVAYLALRWQLWRGRSASVSRQRNLFRP